jgi:hypothetical protein
VDTISPRKELAAGIEQRYPHEPFFIIANEVINPSILNYKMFWIF